MRGNFLESSFGFLGLGLFSISLFSGTKWLFIVFGLKCKCSLKCQAQTQDPQHHFIFLFSLILNVYNAISFHSALTLCETFYCIFFVNREIILNMSKFDIKQITLISCPYFKKMFPFLHDNFLSSDKLATHLTRNVLD